MKTPPITLAGNRSYSDVVCDSRLVTPGCLFVSIPGTTGTGDQYIATARAAGAAAVLGAAVACDYYTPTPREAFAEACAQHYGRPAEQLLLCGLTGTNGKTTTAWLLRDMLAQGGLLPGLITTVAVQWPSHETVSDRTTPDARTLQSTLATFVSAGCRAAVMEVSSHAIDQARIGSTPFALTLFTNLTQDHLDYHGDMEAYYQVKARLFKENLTVPAVINQDDPYGNRLLDELKALGHTALYPYSPSAIQASFSINGIAAEIPLGKRLLSFKTALCGRYNLANILAAATAAHALGVNTDAILTAIVQAQPHWGRLEPAAPGIFIDYAHTDDALVNVLTTLRECTSGRLICLFGCGGDRDKTKRPKMAAAVDRIADLAIVTSDNPRTEDPEAIIADILPGFTQTKPITICDRREAIKRALALKEPTDTILIAGKGHETYQEIHGVKYPFSDADVVRELLK